MQPPPPQYPPPTPLVTPINPRTGLAIGLSLVSCFVMPVVYLGTALLLLDHNRGPGVGPVLASMGVGFVLWVAALIFSIRSIVVSGTIGASRVGGVTALVFSVLAVLTATVSGFFALIFLSGGGAHGRPLRVRGRPRTAPTQSDRAWAEGDDLPRPEVSSMTPDERALHAARWTRDAREEHASVAAFAKLSLDLLALGAPAGLVERTHRAALDEVLHARLAFALASAYAGSPVGPGPWPEALTGERHEASGETLRRVALESLVDGAYGEGLAAWRAREERSTDPAVSAVLEVIARDESEHAALGWEVAAWCVAREPSLGSELSGAAERLVARASTEGERALAVKVSGRLREVLARGDERLAA